MKKIYYVLLVLFFFCIGNSQVVYSKEFSKEISLYKAKKFVIDSILGTTKLVMNFEIDALAATSSGELTSLVYNCDTLNKKGLLLGFYGNYWNESGMLYQGFGFKNLSVEKALQLLNKIDQVKSNYNRYLSIEENSNNVYFYFEDMTFLIYKTTLETKIRVFWKTFDAEWQEVAFNRTKNRFENKIKP